MRSARPQIFVSWLMAVLLTVAPALEAKKLPGFSYRKLGLHVRGGELVASFSFRDVFQPQVRRKLDSGLPTRVLLQVGLEKRGASKPVQYYAQSAEIVYDLWDERYLVAIVSPEGRLAKRVQSATEAIDAVGILWQRQLFAVDDLDRGMYRLRVSVEVNPVSKEMVENIRQWLANPRSSKGTGAHTNFMGSFVGVFVDRRIGQAEARVDFHSQWFHAGEQ